MSFRSASVAAVITVMLVYPGGAVAANLYAPTYGTSPEAIAGFARAADGSLAALAGSPFGFPSTDPGGVITLGFTPDGGRAVSTFLFSGGLRGLTVGADGSIAASAPAVDAPSITGLAVSPDGRFAYAPTVTSRPSRRRSGSSGTRSARTQRSHRFQALRTAAASTATSRSPPMATTCTRRRGS